MTIALLICLLRQNTQHSIVAVDTEVCNGSNSELSLVSALGLQSVFQTAMQKNRTRVFPHPDFSVYPDFSAIRNYFTSQREYRLSVYLSALC
jgi:hypothetical protein